MDHALPELAARPATEQTSLLDRAVVSIGTHWMLALGVLWIGEACGVPFEWTLPAVALAGLAGLFYAVRLPQRYLAKGLYRRALELYERLEASWFSRHNKPVWRLNRAVCHMVLGNTTQARRLLDSVDRSQLSKQARQILDLDLAALHCRVFDPDKAIPILDSLAQERLPRTLNSACHLIRAVALVLKDELAPAMTELETMEKLEPPADQLAALLSTKAWICLQRDPDPGHALSLSRRALDLTRAQWLGRLSILVNHAAVVLEATGNEQDCLDILHQVIGHEHELALTGQSLFHYLVAHCYHACEMHEDAADHAERAADLPAVPWVKRRLAALRSSLPARAAVLVEEA
jgi:tetratricopeptide (TPR) repeat protein